MKKARKISQKYLNCRNISIAGSNRSSYNDDILNVDANNQILPIKCVTDSKPLHDAVCSTKTLTNT